MSVGTFTDKKHQPTDVEVQAALGAKLSLYQNLVQTIREKYPAHEDFKFLYGKNYGWGLRFRIKGQLLTSLYPANDGFGVQINLSAKAVETALSMPLGQRSHDIIDKAHPYPEGRWIFLRVETKADYDDIMQLLELRVKDRVTMVKS